MDGIKLRFTKCMKDYVDCDYIRKLNPYELKWMAQFLEAQYNARPPSHYSKSEKSDSYRRKYLARNDLFSAWIRTPGEIN